MPADPFPEDSGVARARLESGSGIRGDFAGKMKVQDVTM